MKDYRIEDDRDQPIVYRECWECGKDIYEGERVLIFTAIALCETCIEKLTRVAYHDDREDDDGMIRKLRRR